MHLSQHDLFNTLIAITTIAVAILCVTLSINNKLVSKFFGRKLLHIVAVGTCAYAIQQFENRLLPAYIFLAMFFILLWPVQKDWMKANEQKTYGIALFPLAFAILLFADAVPLHIVVYAVLILGISDAMAGICGEYFSKRKTVFLFEQKSWIGFAAFYTSALIISLFFFNGFSLHGILLCLALSLLPALTELFSYRGSDNFTVPLFTAIWALLIIDLNNSQLQWLLLSAVLFAAVAFAAVYKKWLTGAGAAAACWMALLFYVTGGYKAFIVPGIFLISGSLLSKLNQPQKEKEGRNALQVFANGIIGIIFMILFGLTDQTAYLLTAVVSFSISMADSSSSEIGFYLKQRTYDIISMKALPPGVSGGISAAGTLAGLAGAAVIAFAAAFAYTLSFPVFIAILVTGFTGMLTDSILGSWLQVKYLDPEGNPADDAPPGAKKIGGYTWCTNDAVNILSNALITLLFFLFLKQIT
ncbi:DUF92 domain-containing protein [Ferruginibacter sp.]